VRFATDVRSYAEEAIAAFASEPGFAAIEACGPQVPPEDHVVTRYQQKQLGDMAPEWYDFRAIDCASKGEPVGST
jgi:tRNA (guanine-N7-)-methyltransferase